MSSPQLKWIEQPPTMKQTLDSQLATRDKHSWLHAQAISQRVELRTTWGVKNKSELAIRLGQPFIKEPHASHL